MTPEDNMLTPGQAFTALKELEASDHDPELQHLSADIIMYKLLLHLGQEAIVEQYKNMAVDWEYS